QACADAAAAGVVRGEPAGVEGQANGLLVLGREPGDRPATTSSHTEEPAPTRRGLNSDPGCGSFYFAAQDSFRSPAPTRDAASSSDERPAGSTLPHYRRRGITVRSACRRAPPRGLPRRAAARLPATARPPGAARLAYRTPGAVHTGRS